MRENVTIRQRRSAEFNNKDEEVSHIDDVIRRDGSSARESILCHADKLVDSRRKSMKIRCYT